MNQQAGHVKELWNIGSWQVLKNGIYASLFLNALILRSAANKKITIEHEIWRQLRCVVV
jgi:hypothetical protein